MDLIETKVVAFGLRKSFVIRRGMPLNSLNGLTTSGWLTFRVKKNPSAWKYTEISSKLI